LGWQTGELYPGGCGHTGFTGTSLYISRKGNIGVAALTNRLFFPGPNPHSLNEFRKALHQAVFQGSVI
jgi:CubicO group peptidase (beta-lactamase class C family)